MAQPRRDTPGRQAIADKGTLAVQKALEEHGLSIQDFLKSIGEAPPRGLAPTRRSRKERRQAWMDPGHALKGEELDAVKRLPKVLGKGPHPDEPRALTQDEVDALMEEAAPIRLAQDALNGRHDAIRAIVFNAITAEKGDDAESGAIRASDGRRFERRVHWEQGDADLSALEGVVDDVTWRRISRVRRRREVDPLALRREMERNPALLDRIQELVPDAVPRAKFYVREGPEAREW